MYITHVDQVVKELLQKEQNLATLIFVFHWPVKTAQACQAGDAVFAVGLRGEAAFTLAAVGEVGAQLVAAGVTHVTTATLATLTTLLVQRIASDTVSGAFAC